VHRSRLPAAIIGILIILSGCSKSTFQKRYDVLVAQNPSDLQFEIKTNNDQTDFRISERVPVYMLYSSKFPGRWRLEILDGWNFASVSDKLFFSFEAVEIERPLDGRTVICCDSRQVWLSSETTRIPYRFFREPYPFPRSSLFRYFRLRQPGKYAVFVQSHRTFPADSPKKNYQDQGRSLTSNQLKLRIIENDAEWDSRELKKTISELDGSDPSQRASACDRLAFDLSGNDAVAESLRRLRLHLSCGQLETLKNARDPVKAMDELTAFLNDPNVGVPENAKYILAELKVRSKFPGQYVSEDMSDMVKWIVVPGSTRDDWMAAEQYATAAIVSACKGKRESELQSCSKYPK
jgi:hypothetical protein